MEIGANTTIDRGGTRDTVIGEGTKIDNLVQIGHNCSIGRHCLIVSQAGISGSVTVGDFVDDGRDKWASPTMLRSVPAPNSARRAGVMSNVPARRALGRLPGRAGHDWKRGAAILRRMVRRSRKSGDNGEHGGGRTNDRREQSEVADIREILRLLPHRYPFVMIDRIIDIRGDEHGIGIKNVTINEPHFLGHFPENPVMPGVLLIEGHGADGGRAVPAADGRRRRAPRRCYFLTIDKAKFRKPAVPGDTIDYHVDKIAHRRNMWWYRAEAKVGDVLIAEAEVGAVITEA